MSIEDCITAYGGLSEKVFQKWSNISAIKVVKAAAGRPWFDASVLEETVRELLRNRGMGSDVLFRKESDPACKV